VAGPWINEYRYSKISEEEIGAFLHLKSWMERIAERDAVKRGCGSKYELK